MLMIMLLMTKKMEKHKIHKHKEKELSKLINILSKMNLTSKMN